MIGLNYSNVLLNGRRTNYQIPKGAKLSGVYRTFMEWIKIEPINVILL